MSDNIAAVAATNSRGERTVQRVSIARYRPGKAPAGYQSDDDESDAHGKSDNDNVDPFRHGAASEELSVVTLNISAVDVQNDPRLRRLWQTERNRVGDDNTDTRIRNHRQKNGSSSDEDLQEKDNAKMHEINELDEDSISRRRELLKQKMLRQAEVEVEQLELEKESEEEEDESSEYETNSEDDIVPSRTLAKPKFVPRQLRESNDEKERLKREEEEEEKREKERRKERQQETRQMVVDEIKRGLQSTVTTEEMQEVDDTDGIDEQLELEAWKLRELKRIQRKRDEQRKFLQEQADIKRRRNMTEAEKAAEDALVAKERDEARKNKPKMRFLQKYYHKGAFYQDANEEIYKRSFTEATLEDHFDKVALPKVMQVKNFGKSSQTKWTHLSNEDTTSQDALWYQNKELARKMDKKRGGMRRIDAPTGNSKR